MSTTPLSDAVSVSHGPHVSTWALFLSFSQITLSGFGGLVFWARRVLVERRGWLTEQEFVDLLALGQLLPGPNILNLTVMVGYRFAGWAGAAAAVAGFLGWPCLVVIALGVLHQHYGTLPLVQHALTGMSAVAAGLLLASVVKMASVLPRQWRPWLFAGLAFVGVGVLRWPLLWVMAGLAPCAVALAWKGRD
jgi:chromate transporter